MMKARGGGRAAASRAAGTTAAAGSIASPSGPGSAGNAYRLGRRDRVGLHVLHFDKRWKDGFILLQEFQSRRWQRLGRLKRRRILRIEQNLLLQNLRSKRCIAPKVLRERIAALRVPEVH